MQAVIGFMIGVVAGYLLRAQIGAEWTKLHDKLVSLEAAIKAKL